MSFKPLTVKTSRVGMIVSFKPGDNAYRSKITRPGIKFIVPSLGPINENWFRVDDIDYPVFGKSYAPYCSEFYEVKKPTILIDLEDD